MTRRDPELPAVFTTGEARRRGLTPAQVRRRVTSGRWRVLRRGVYCLAERWDAADPAERHLLRAIAAHTLMPRTMVLSHATGAVVHDLPTPWRPGPVWATAPSGGTTRYRDDVRVEVASLSARDRTRLRGLRVTSLPRTLADVLRHAETDDAVAVLDAALRRDPTVLDDVLEVLHRCAGWPYAELARDRIPLLDGRRESPLESRSYVAMWRRRVPLPEPQVVIGDERGRFVARVDGWWDEWAAAGEVDGVAKYGDAMGAARGDGRDADRFRRRLVAEKRREDDLRALGVTVVRWGAEDLADECRWAARVLEQVRSGDRSRFRGTLLRRGTAPLLLRPRIAP